jgi:hypothetical protein
MLRCANTVATSDCLIGAEHHSFEASCPPLNVLFCIDVNASMLDGIEVRPAYRSNTPVYLPGHSFANLLRHLISNFSRIIRELKGKHWVAYGAAEYAQVDSSNPAQSCRKLAGLTVFEHLSQLGPLITMTNGVGFFRAWSSSHANFIDGGSMKLGLLPVVVLYIQRYETALELVSHCDRQDTQH